MSEVEIESVPEEVTIDCSGIQTTEQFWEIYVREAQVHGSQYFGRNLDALWDGLNGGPGMPRFNAVRLKHSDSLGHLLDGRFLAALKRIAANADAIRLIVEEGARDES
ncbi:barstar family protein [Deinococcus yunweiensis]|uniref:barstar family protein n=1 Tax=Deinococcus yunweiensis TaxID=367282 RepID=UPI00398F41D1